MKKRIFAITLAALMILCLFAGCKKTEKEKSNDETATGSVVEDNTGKATEPETTTATEPSTEEPTDPVVSEPGTAMTKEAAREVLSKTEAITKNEKNIDLDMLIDTVILLKDEKGNTAGKATIALSGSVKANDHASIVNMTLSSNMLESGSSYEVITIESKDAITTYTKQDGQDYYTMTVADKSSVQEATAGFGEMLTAISDFDWEGEETSSAYVLKHVVTSDESGKIFGAMASIGTNLLNDDSVDMAGTVLIYRINKDTYMPIDLTADMGEPMKRQLPNAEGGSIDKCLMVLTINSYGTVGEITAPKNVLASDDPTILTPPTIEGEAAGNGVWEDMRIVIDGVEYTAGDPYSKFAANGWTCDLEEYGGKDAMIEAGEVVEYFATLKSERYGDDYEAPEIGVMIGNYSDTAKKLSECNIAKISVSGAYGLETRKDDFDFSMPCGLKRGMTKQEVFQVLGEPSPSNVYVSEILDYTSLTYMDSEKGYCLELTIYDKEGLQEVSLTIFE